MNPEVAVDFADSIEHFCNRARGNSALGYLTPNDCEGLHSTRTQAGAS